MEQRLTLVTLGVRDLARSTRFLERLGWRRSVARAEGVAFFQCGGVALSLFPLEELARDANLPSDAGPGGFGGFALAHNVRSRAEVDEVLREAVAAGAELAKPAEEAPWGGYSGYFRDPDGHLWEVAWNPHFPLGEDGSVTLPD